MTDNASSREGPSLSKEEAAKASKVAQGNSNSNSSSPDDREIAAASLIQRNYRGYKTRRELQGMGLDAGARWDEAFHHMKLDDAREQQLGKKQGGGKSDAANRWKRGGVLVGQIAGSPSCGGSGDKKNGGTDSKAAGPIGTDGPVQGGPTIHEDGRSSGSGESSAPAEGAPQKTKSEGMVGDVPGAQEDGKIDNVKPIAKRNQHGLKMIEWWTRGSAAQDLSKTMEAAYWLEMVDKKHRYGSNLKPYHAAWSSSDTKENFFVWLDEGGGRDMDLDDCPRERLESERITYLTADQRRNYIVDVKDGKLYWRRNGKPLDTTRGKHKDLGDGQGIVELGPEEQEEQARIQEEERERRRAEGGSVSSLSSASSSSLSSDSEAEEAEKREAQHYGADMSKKKRRLGLLSSTGFMDALLRKTVQNNTWIYVLNARGELYVGIKQTGKFQHSSFLFGGRVLSAGLLKAKDGTLTSLSPLSGHYRAGTAHFRHFITLLQQEGVDLDHVTLSKSLLLLRGMEAYGSVTKKKKKTKKAKTEKEGAAGKSKAVVSKLTSKRAEKCEMEAAGGGEGKAKGADRTHGQQNGQAGTGDGQSESHSQNPSKEQQQEEEVERDRGQTLLERLRSGHGHGHGDSAKASKETHEGGKLSQAFKNLFASSKGDKPDSSASAPAAT